MTPQWSDDFSTLTREQMFQFMSENRAWNKRLRERTAALVNTRLSKAITQEEYTASRQSANHDVAECKRRGEMLVRDIGKREI